MPRPLESVPNFSEGRDRTTIDALAEALRSGGARLLDVHADEDHNRSVFTLVGSGDELVESLLAGIARAAELIDLRKHEGAHPRIGAADVVPLVPLADEDEERAREAAERLAARVGAELGLPVFLYGALGGGRGPAFFRQGGPEELQRRVDAGELAPEHGPARLSDSAGGVLVGVRRPLIAFNVNLRGTLEAAREIAALVRETGGGFPGVRALGLELPRAGLVQVSMNVEDWEAAAAALDRGRGGTAGGRARGGGGRLRARRPDARRRRRGSRRSGAADRRLRRLARARAAPARRLSRALAEVTHSSRFRDRHARPAAIRSPRGGGRANRTQGAPPKGAPAGAG